MGNTSSGRGGLPVDKTRSAKRLLNQGMAKGRTAHVLGIAWRSADKLSRPEQSPQQGEQAYVRCAGCGGLVVMPCRLCTLRAIVKRRGKLQPRRGRNRSAILP